MASYVEDRTLVSGFGVPCSKLPSFFQSIRLASRHLGITTPMRDCPASILRLSRARLSGRCDNRLAGHHLDQSPSDLRTSGCGCGGMSVVETISSPHSPNGPPHSGQQSASTGASTGCCSAADFGSVRRRKGPCPGFRLVRLGFGLWFPFGKWRRRSPPLQLFDLCSQLLNQSLLIEDDLDQLVKTERV
jgi:hypothetical protein